MKYIKKVLNSILTIATVLLAGYMTYDYLYPLTVSLVNTPPANGRVIELNDSTFRAKVFDYTSSTEWHYKGDKPCVIDFNADWCGPCQRLKPTIEYLAREYAGQIYVYSVNVDSCPLARRVMGVKAFPTVFMVPMTEIPTKNVGVVPRYKLKSQISRLLLKENK